jgi:hypothetical protein
MRTDGKPLAGFHPRQTDGVKAPVTTDPPRPVTLTFSVRRRLFVIAAIGSVVSMPLTAIWFLVFGLAMVGASPLVAVALRSSASRGPIVSWLLSVGPGLSVGPLIYVGLALII